MRPIYLKINCIFGLVNTHQKYMSRCISLAKNGLGSTYPNPLVGSVIVRDNVIIAEGWHQKAGTPHAEVHAINAVKKKYGERASEILSTATIYVCLEPCSHFGKTPPCADLIIKEGIKRVVIGCTDPNPQVAGRGIKKLLDTGCEVIVGILEVECKALNKRFFTFQNKKRPYIILKWAETADGFIAPSTKNTQKPVWITNKHSRQLAHKLRAEEQAILIGTNTAIDDNPSLTTRDWNGANPIRIIIDKSLKISENAQVFNNKTTTVVITEKEKTINGSTEYAQVSFDENLITSIIAIVYDKGLQSIIIEGGSKTLQSFIDENLWDEALVFRGPLNMNNGIKAPTLKGRSSKTIEIKDDRLNYYLNTNNGNV